MTIQESIEKRKRLFDDRYCLSCLCKDFFNSVERDYPLLLEALELVIRASRCCGCREGICDNCAKYKNFLAKWEKHIEGEK